MNRLIKNPCVWLALSVLLGLSALPALGQEPAKLDPVVAEANAERAKLISPVPASTGDYTFIAGQLRHRGRA